jgi:hypothetical protein
MFGQLAYPVNSAGLLWMVHYAPFTVIDVTDMKSLTMALDQSESPAMFTNLCSRVCVADIVDIRISSTSRSITTNKTVSHRLKKILKMWRYLHLPATGAL